MNYFKPGYWVVLLALLPFSSLKAQAVERRDLPSEKDLVQASPVKINITGGNEALRENMEALMPSRRYLQCDSEKEAVERFVDASKDKLSEAAEALGYFDAAFNMQVRRVGGCWQFDVNVEQGNAVKIKDQKINITGGGVELESFKALRDKPPFNVGDNLDQQVYEDYKTTLNNTSNRLGFFDAEYKKREVQVDPDKLEAAVHLDYDTGGRYRISTLDVEQDVLDDKYLQRYLQVRAGDYYDSEALLKQQRLLESSSYFRDVQLITHHSKAKNKQIPVAIKAERRKRYTYAGKVGYSTDEGSKIEARMDAHWVNRKGHKLAVEGMASKPEQALGFNYKIPLWEPEHEFVALSGGWESSTADDVESDAYKIEFSYNRRNDSDWQQAAFIRYLYETTNTIGEDETVAQLTLLGAKVSKTETDDLLFPKFGWNVSLELQGAHEDVLSDQTLFQGKVTGKYLHTFNSGRKLIAHGSAGATLTDDLTEMPKSLRFFAGGQNSIRGYSYQSLGKVDDEGKVIGGKNVLTGSLEYEVPVTGNWSGAVFADAGNAFEDWSDYEVKVGYGAGVRYKSPLGMIRADIAVPKDDTSDAHFYFSLGPDL